MAQLIVISFITLDGVAEDPDGGDGTAFGGWAMRAGPAAVAGDKFGLGDILETGTLLFGRRTWNHFSTMWPRRADPFSQTMNRATKAVVTSRPVDTSVWSGSSVVDGPVEAWVDKTRQDADIVVIGSTSLVDRLAAADLVDEYRLLTFPVAVGEGRRLFGRPVELRLVRSQASEFAVLTTLRPVRASARSHLHV